MADITLRILGQEPLPLNLGSDNSETLSVGSGVTEGRLQEVLQDYVPKSDIDSTLSISGDVAEAKATGDAIADINAKLADILPSDSASGAIASFPDGAKDFPVKSLEVDIEPKQSGSGTPAPDNVRPITGYDNVVVTRAGKNLFDMYGKDGKNAISKNVFLKAGTYTTSASGISGNYATYVRRATTEGSITGEILASKVNQGNFTFTLSSDTAIVVHWYEPNDSSATLAGQTYQLEVGSSATTYSPYTGSTYTIPLPSTVYGGTLNVTTGTLTVDRAMVDLGTLTWGTGSTSQTGKVRFRTDSIKTEIVKAESASVMGNIICSSYANTTANQSYTCVIGICVDNIGSVYVYDPNYSDAATFKTAMNGVQLVYELATPTTVSLTPTEIKTLLGDNNIFSDSGDVAVVYSADIAKYIDKRLGA